MAQSIEDVLAKLKPPVRSVAVCLDGELWARHDVLSRQVDEAKAQGGGGKLGDASGVGPLMEELRAVEQQMRDAEVEFKFRGLSTFKLEEIEEKYPAKGGAGIASKGVPVLLAAAAVDPVMTEDQARELMVTDGIGDKLFRTAMLASQGSLTVPFSGRASASTGGFGSK